MIERGLLIISLLVFWLSIFSQDDCQQTESKQAKKSFEKAMDKISKGEFVEGSNLLREAVTEDPDYVEAWWILAEINMKYSNRMRKTAIAQEAYTEVIRICPSYRYFYSYFYLGQIYFAAEKWKEAYDNYTAFLNSGSESIKEAHETEASTYSEIAKFYAEIYSNKVMFDPKVLADVSSANDEYLPIITPDNNYVYFTRRSSERQLSGYAREENRVERFSVAKFENGKYSIGKPLGYPFNEQSNEGGATLTIDNKELFYTRCKTNSTRYLNCDICYTQFSNGSWSEIQTLGNEINTPDSWESMPTISSDGKTLYFVSDRKDGLGGYDIYYSNRNEDGSWSVAKNAGSKINTPGNEKSPFLHTDSKTLYFSSSSRRDEKTGENFKGWMGIGGYDIFFTRLNDDGNWTVPKNIGYPINSIDDDLGFFVSTDGKYGYFASNKFNDQKDWNIYSFELYQEARPEKVLFVKGVMKDETTNEVIRDAKIEIKSVDSKKVTKINVDNETGEYVMAVSFKNDYVMTVKSRDYVYISKYVSKKDVAFETPSSIDFKLKKIEIGKNYNLDDIYYETNSDILTIESKSIIDNFFEFLYENPNIHIEIQGHTDNVGSDEYNLELSERRAKAVFDELVKMGIQQSRMTYKGYGETSPIADNNSELGRQMNRRTVFQITDK